MEDKTYGVKSHLIEEFKQFQISRQKERMAFIGDCYLLINAEARQVRVHASNGVLSITPFPLMAGGLIEFRVPSQHLTITGPTVPILLDPLLKITLIFSSHDEIMEFLRFLNLNTSSSDETSSSGSRRSNPTPDSGII